MRLPGEVTSNAPTQTADGARWAAAFGDAEVAMEATGDEQRTTSTVAALVAATCAVLLLLYGVVRVVRWLRRRRRPATEA